MRDWAVAIGLALFIAAGLWATFTKDYAAEGPACVVARPGC